MTVESKEGEADQVRMSQHKDSWKPLRKIQSTPADSYRIGKVGFPWGEEEKAEWLAQTKRHRSYIEEVVDKLEGVDNSIFETRQYGALESDPSKFPLMAVISKNWDVARPAVLVTGGVHGYETSGVQGAVLFATEFAAGKYSELFNIVVLPCVSPWGYERIERWNSHCLDPNRSFGPDPSTHTEESAAVKKLLVSLGVVDWVCHIDCHETTDTDETEFMPARAALSGAVYKRCEIPDGFYLVGNSDKPALEWHNAVIDSVRKVTHICPGDRNKTIIEEPLVSDGVVLVPADKLGLCASVTDATYATTTEVYPDSPKVTDEQCNRAQVAAITGALDHICEVRGMQGN